MAGDERVLTLQVAWLAGRDGDRLPDQHLLAALCADRLDFLYVADHP